MVTFEIASKCLVSPEAPGGILASLVAYLFYALPCPQSPKLPMVALLVSILKGVHNEDMISGTCDLYVTDSQLSSLRIF